MRYVQPTSVTWWAGLAAIVLGVAGIGGLDDPQWGEIASVLALAYGGGDASPAALIVLGLGLIGVRDKLERG